MPKAKSNNKPSFALYAVRGDGEEANWSRIGAAWDHKDGEGFSITLDAIPLSGRIVMRRPKAEEGGAQ